MTLELSPPPEVALPETRPPRAAALPSTAVYALLLAVALFGAYLPVLHAYYLHTDDYFWTSFGQFSASSIVVFMAIVGRPLGGVFFDVLHVFHHVQELNAVRFVSLLTVLALTIVTFRWLRLHAVEARIAALAAVMIGMAAPFQVYVAYVSTYPVALSVLLAMLACFLIKDQTVGSVWRSWPRTILAIAVLIASLCLYQLGTFYFWAMLSVPVMMAEPRTLFRRILPRLVYAFVVLTAAIAIYYAFWRFGLTYYQVPLFGKYDGRMFVQDPLERLSWFFHSALFEASNLWSITPSAWLAWLVGGLAVIGACSDLLDPSTHRNGLAGIVQAVGKSVLLLSFFPAVFVLVLADSSPTTEYRTYVSLVALFILFIALGLANLTRRNTRATSGLSVGLAAVAVAAMFVSNSNLANYFVLPDSLELRHMRSEFLRGHPGPTPVAGVHVVRLQQPVAPAQRNEIGEPSAVAGQNIRPMVMAALNGLVSDDLRVAYSDHVDDPQWVEFSRSLQGTDLPRWAIDADPSWVVIDMSTLNSDARISDD